MKAVLSVDEKEIREAVAAFITKKLGRSPYASVEAHAIKFDVDVQDGTRVLIASVEYDYDPPTIDLPAGHDH